jgi:hypothetical protein
LGCPSTAFLLAATPLMFSPDFPSAEPFRDCGDSPFFVESSSAMDFRLA